MTNLVIIKDPMRSVRVSQLKSRLSEYLRSVKDGSPILITDRGHPVAVLQPYKSQDADLDSLVESGVVLPARRPLDESFWDLPRPEDPGARVREALLEERREGR